jgi:pyrroline-5-carboxylate reductase
LKISTSILNEWNHLKIGVVGCGHLGQAIVELFITHGFSKNNIYLSYHGSPSTYKQLRQKGLTGCITDNVRLFNKADLIIVTVKPNDMVDLMDLTVSKGSAIVSCAAGATTATLEGLFHQKVIRMMVSGPDTISAGKGIAAIYPDDRFVGRLLNETGLRLFKLTCENDLNVFTAGVCLPGILLRCHDEEKIQNAITEMEQDYPWFPKLFSWSKTVLPVLTSEQDKQAYIAKMITAGGVTEAIMNRLQSGEDLLTALKSGIMRSQSISEEISHLINDRRHV